MFDADMHPSLALHLAALERASGAQVTVLVDQLSGGEWGRGILAGTDSPVTVITVTSQARPFRHAIAAYQVELLLRRMKQGEMATNNPVHQQAVFDETKAKFADQVPAERLPGLAKILYDGISQQLRASVSGLTIHRAILRDHPTLAAQHRNWIHALLAQNQVFLDQIRQSGGAYPERLVKWNRTMLVLESLGQARLKGEGTPEFVADLTADIALVSPLVESVVAGDADGLTDRQLTGLAAKTVGVPEDWLTWVPREQVGNATRPLSHDETLSLSWRIRQVERISI